MPSSEDTKTPIPPASAPKKTAAVPTQSVSAHGDAAFPYARKGPIVAGARQPHPGRWKHEAAAALHCWAQCAHHTAKEMELSDADYVKALAAACKLNSKGHYTPHEPALYAVPTPKA